MTRQFAHGLIVGKFYPPHAGHAFLVRMAAKLCDRVTVAVLASSVESIPLATRLAWLREEYAALRGVVVVGEMDDVAIDFDDARVWDEHEVIMRRALATAVGPPVDAVFTSEPYGAELARRFAAANVCLDPARTTVRVSATAVRRDPVAHWDFMAPAVRAWFAKRVVVVGAESTGTTTLARDLRDALRSRGGVWASTEYVAEYGRDLSLAKLAALRGIAARNGLPSPSLSDVVWNSADFVDVAATQTEAEDTAARQSGPLVVCDTDAFATQIWHERYVGGTNDEVTAIVSSLPPRAVYLLTSESGVPFYDDGLRDGEHLRTWMTERFRQELAKQAVPWVELVGSRAARLDHALRLVDEHVESGWRLADPLG